MDIAWPNADVMPEIDYPLACFGALHGWQTVVHKCYMVVTGDLRPRRQDRESGHAEGYYQEEKGAALH
jgi:hypothetical protein